MKAYKFKVDSPEQSERLQKVLFELGYEWQCSGKQTIVEEINYVLVSSNGTLNCCSYDSTFDAIKSKEKDTEKFIRRHNGGQAERGNAKHSKKAVKKDKWISIPCGGVEDKLPKLGVEYLVYNNSFLIAFQTSDRKWYSYDPKGYVSDVTHYRKLPKGPK